MMRPKQERLVLTFAATADAIAAEQLCQRQGFPGRLIPTPPIITASCGMAWAMPVEEGERVREALREQGVEAEQAYRMLL